MTARAAARYDSLAMAARAIAKDFLQSVVVVDDRAAFGGEDGGPLQSSAVTPGGVATDRPEEPIEATPRGRTNRRLPNLQLPKRDVTTHPEQALNAKVLVDGFAKEGLVCAVIKPDSSESPVELTVSASRRADIVILDWELNRDDGASTLAIVRRLVHEEAEASPRGRLRLIAIYSGALTLRQIASRLRKALSGERGSTTFRKDGEFAITAGSVRVTVFGKPTTRLNRADQELRERVIDGEDLPEIMITEFSKMTIGLVPHVALASLAALRKNMHRVLARLRADLDPAYLWHRATQMRPADAEVHLVDLVASELRSVLEDERVGDWADLAAIEQWILRNGQSEYGPAFGETKPVSADDVLALLKKGAAGKREINRDVREKFPKICVERMAHREKGIAGFANSANAAKLANEHLAALMSLRTRYQHPIPRLELGTILTRGRGNSRTYWLCVQPRCDSVRLQNDTAFPLLPLRIAEDGKKFDVLLPDGKGGYRRFRLLKKPAEIDMQVFGVYPHGGDTIEAERSGHNFVFRSRARHVYVWVAELKPEYAQRIAQDIANEFSRVGLTESEWLRLWATKG